MKLTTILAGTLLFATNSFAQDVKKEKAPETAAAPTTTPVEPKPIIATSNSKFVDTSGKQLDFMAVRMLLSTRHYKVEPVAGKTDEFKLVYSKNEIKVESRTSQEERNQK